MGAPEPGRGPEGRDLALSFASVVLLDPPFVHADRRFTYSVPEQMALARGSLVRVPVRGRSHRAVVLDVLDEPDVDRVVPVRAALGPGLPTDITDLALWTAERYLSTEAEALVAAVPERVASEEGAGAPRATTHGPIPRAAPELGDVIAAVSGGSAGGGFVWRPDATADRAPSIVALVAAALQRERGALVLLPEVRVFGGVASALDAAFGEQVAWLSSDRSARARYRDWIALRSGAKRVAVGGRSAVFAPVPDLGVVIVDDEAHASYKGGRAPRFHARTVAAERARRAEATLVLVGVPPSVEARAAAEGAAYTFVAPERAAERGNRPPVTVIDRRIGEDGHTPAGRTLATCRGAIGTGGRALFLSHRGGEALGTVATRAARALGAGDAVLLSASDGPDALDRAARARLVVATPFAAKDVDLGEFAVLCVIDADAAAAHPEFRAAEEAFATWWRLARTVATGAIVIETTDPDAPSIRALTRWDPDVLARAESSRRSELGYPPFAVLARIDVPPERAAAVAEQVARDASLEVLGPAERDGRHVVIVRARTRQALETGLRPLVREWRADDAPMRVDVEPWEVWVPRWRS